MSRKSSPASCAAIEHAAGILRGGGIVAFPTETVYGLGADALNADAVARIFEAKQRPLWDPLIVHIARMEEMAFVVRPNALARRLADAFWPGPLTMVLPKRERIPGIVTAGLDTVAVRLPDHPVARQLIERTGRPVAAPSANPFGRTSPTRAAHVEKHLGPAVDMILGGDACRHGIESTILSLEDEASPRILRLGSLPVEDIQAVIGPLCPPEPKTETVSAPGMLPCHYAPLTPVRLVGEDAPPLPADGRRIGLLTLTPPTGVMGYQAVEVLSADGDLKAAAANLFAALHRLDCAGLDQILAIPVPEHDMGAAIMDRLRRAARAGCHGAEIKNNPKSQKPLVDACAKGMRSRPPGAAGHADTCYRGEEQV